MATSTADFAVGDVVQHVFFGTYGTVTKVGRKYLHVEVHVFRLNGNPLTTWRPTSVRKVGS